MPDTLDAADTLDAEATLTTREVAAELGVTDRTVRRFADRGLLPVVRISPTSPRQFRREDVERMQRIANAELQAADAAETVHA